MPYRLDPPSTCGGYSDTGRAGVYTAGAETTGYKFPNGDSSYLRSSGRVNRLKNKFEKYERSILVFRFVVSMFRSKH
jgi:hypothetical protein